MDDYHCFLLEPHLAQDMFATSAVVQPQQPGIVHHVILFIDTTGASQALDDAGLKADDVKLFIPHQANQRITDAVANKLNVENDRVYSNIAMHGNTSSASIPIGLDECVEAGRIKKDDIVLLASFGGGVTWGAVVIRW